MFGLSNEIIEKIKEITNKYDINFLIFGSRARGDYKNTSDIDIAVENNVTQEQKYQIINDFDLLDVIYKIDLVFMQDIKNDKFLESIKKEGKKI